MIGAGVIFVVLKLSISLFSKVIFLPLFSALPFILWSKTFDKVDHQLSLKKLEIIGVKAKVYDLLKSYFCDRDQIVKTHDKYSTQKKITYWIPQGTVLDPFHLIYITNLSENILKDVTVEFHH